MKPACWRRWNSASPGTRGGSKDARRARVLPKARSLGNTQSRSFKKGANLYAIEYMKLNDKNAINFNNASNLITNVLEIRSKEESTTAINALLVDSTKYLTSKELLVLHNRFKDQIVVALK